MHERRAWLVETLAWVETNHGRREEVADLIIEVFGKGVSATGTGTPPDT